jgi:hypothetical protein
MSADSDVIACLVDVLEVVSREWKRTGERARFLEVVELPDKSRQKCVLPETPDARSDSGHGSDNPQACPLSDLYL